MIESYLQLPLQASLHCSMHSALSVHVSIATLRLLVAL